MPKRIYLDHAAATPLDPEVIEVIKSCIAEIFGNPSSLHQEGREAKSILDESRKSIANHLNAQPEEIIFTGSGTESCNLAILGVAYAKQNSGKHIITTKAEHHAILAPSELLENAGWDVTYLDVDEYGMVSPQDVKEAVKEDTVLVSIMMVNNEVGSINPIKEITRAVKKTNPNTLIHTDACQAAGLMKLDVKSLGIDLLTINSAKIDGPKGAAALYKKKGIELVPLIAGGGQENNMRSGTENIAAIAGFAKALELVIDSRQEESLRLKSLRDEMIAKLEKEIPAITLNGHPEKRIENNVNISIPGYDGETLVIYLDQAGIACSTAAACTTSSTEPSHVLLAMGKDEDYAKSSLRFTLGKSTTKDDLNYTIKKLKESLRILSK